MNYIISMSKIFILFWTNILHLYVISPSTRMVDIFFQSGQVLKTPIRMGNKILHQKYTTNAPEVAFTVKMLIAIKYPAETKPTFTRILSLKTVKIPGS